MIHPVVPIALGRCMSDEAAVWDCAETDRSGASRSRLRCRETIRAPQLVEEDVQGDEGPQSRFRLASCSPTVPACFYVNQKPHFSGERDCFGPRELWPWTDGGVMDFSSSKLSALKKSATEASESLSANHDQEAFGDGRIEVEKPRVRRLTNKSRVCNVSRTNIIVRYLAFPDSTAPVWRGTHFGDDCFLKPAISDFSCKDKKRLYNCVPFNAKAVESSYLQSEVNIYQVNIRYYSYTVDHSCCLGKPQLTFCALENHTQFNIMDLYSIEVVNNSGSQTGYYLLFDVSVFAIT